MSGTVDDGFVQALDDHALSQLAQMVAAEQQQRALAAADLDALVEYGFAERFASNGMPLDPEIVSGMVVCAGAKNDRSNLSHDCAFVHLGDDWVWDSPETAADVVRYVAGPKTRMRSVSLVPARDGMELDLVASRMRAGMHQMREVRSFKVRDGKLELVGARARTADGHR
jgi:hypothetical protein